MFGIYKRYKYPVSLRNKLLNVFRYVFTFQLLEKFIVSKLSTNHFSWWKKFVPPLYLYNEESYRTIERNGMLYRLDISKLLDHARYFFNDTQDASLTNLFNTLKSHFHVLDIGANIGLLTLPFAKRCTQGVVYCFEPGSENFRRLNENVKANDMKNVILFKQALGDKSGSSTLYHVEPTNPGMNRILPEKPERELSREVVKVSCLDDLYGTGHFSRADLIKIDAEGFEMLILKGAQKLIKEMRPILFIELADENLKMQGSSALELIGYIENLEYRVFNAKDMSTINKSEIPYTDVICFPR